MGTIKTLLIIPAFNEEDTIGFVVGQAHELARRGTISGFLVVSDGSTDKTDEIARAFGAEVLRLGQNYGKGAAALQGFLWAKRNGADVAMMADADVLSGFTPAQALFMLSELDSGAVGGRKTMMTVYPTLENGVHSPPMFSGFRAIRMQGINFLFVQKEGAWQFSSSHPAKRFFEGASGFGLEAMLNEIFKLRTIFLAQDAGAINLKTPYRGSEEKYKNQSADIRNAGQITYSRKNQASRIRELRSQKHRAGEPMPR